MSTSSGPIKLGVVGLSVGKGSWAENAHLPYLKGTSAYKITAIQNSSVESSKAAASEFGLGDVATYGDIASLVKDPDVDTVLVSVKVPGHAALIRPALEAGKNVFCEWPLARHLAEAEELTSLAKKQNVRTMVGAQARQNSAIRKAKAMIDAGELGDIVASNMNATGGLYGPGFFTERNSYLCDIENGANNLTIPCMHASDAMCYVLGELEYVQATLVNHQHKVQITDADQKPTRMMDKTAHDTISYNGRMKRGGIATVVYQNGISQTGKGFYWEITGTKGSLVLEHPNKGHVQMFHPRISFVKAEQGATLTEIEVEKAENFSYNVGRAWDIFAGKEDGSIMTFDNALVRHKMIDAIYRSDKNGKRETYV